MSKTGLAAAIFAIVAAFMLMRHMSENEVRPGCAGPALRTAEAREAAMMEGYEIIRMYDCISKESYEQAAEQRELAKNRRNR
jgi:hypothetical protein